MIICKYAPHVYCTSNEMCSSGECIGGRCGLDNYHDDDDDDD